MSLGMLLGWRLVACWRRVGGGLVVGEVFLFWVAEEVGRSAAPPCDDLDFEFWGICTDSVIPDIAADLLGPNVRFREIMLNFKWAGGGAEAWCVARIEAEEATRAILLAATRWRRRQVWFDGLSAGRERRAFVQVGAIDRRQR